jgi:nickel/cobalt exporter
MRLLRFLLILAVAVLTVGALARLFDLSSVMVWASGVQRDVQNAMAGSLRAIRAGDPRAMLGLCALTFAYGFVHAVGPGHGKFLIGGTALANRATLRRLSALTLAASLAQSLTAVVLVLIGTGLLSLTSSYLVDMTEDILAPASYAAIGLIGGYLALRGGRSLWRALAPAVVPPVPSDRHHHQLGHAHDDACGCGHAHGPTPDQVREQMGLREMAALVASIALRPCTGALFLLVIAWGLGLLPAGILATFAMGLGTASFNVIVAGSGAGAHAMMSVLGGGSRLSPLVSPVAQLSAGLIVVAASAGMLVLYL